MRTLPRHTFWLDLYDCLFLYRLSETIGQGIAVVPFALFQRVKDPDSKKSHQAMGRAWSRFKQRCRVEGLAGMGEEGVVSLEFQRCFDLAIKVLDGKAYG